CAFTAKPYFNEKDLYHVTCWPVGIVENEVTATEADPLREAGYEYLGTVVKEVAPKSRECMNWLGVITNRGEDDPKGDASFRDSGMPSQAISVEYYADHNQCRWLPMHWDEKISDTGGYKDPESDDGKPASGPWCYVNDAEANPLPVRCLPACGDNYEMTREKKPATHKSLVSQPKINHHLTFTEPLGSIFAVDEKQREKIYVKPSMVDHAAELLEQKRVIFYACCGAVGAVILWITACHFLGERVKRRRLAIVAIQQQAIAASITRRRRDSQQEHEEEDARE
ncbi:hypothetical protein PENTCL1PPCAC_24306, partial [Pristionchus entomophagus]